MYLRELLKRETQRRIYIVELLYYADSPLSANYLTNALNCSLPALHGDIYALNTEDFPLNIVKSHGGYTIQFHSYASIDSLYAEMIKTSLDFQVLKRVFFQKFYSIRENANYLKCSFSSFYTKVTQLDYFFLQWGIKLTTRPLKIASNEKLLRHFYYLLFKEHRLAFHEYGFSDMLVRLIDRYIRDVLIVNQVENTMNTHFHLMHHFLICLHRRRKGYELKFKQTTTFGLHLPESSTYIELALRIKQECHITFCDALIIEALWPFFSGNLVLTAHQQTVLQQNNKTLARFYSQHTNLLGKLNQAAGNTLTEEEIQLALRHLGNELFIYYPEQRPMQILSQQRKYSLLRLKKIYARPINQLTNIIKSFLKSHQLPTYEETIETYLWSLIVSIDNLMDRLSVQAVPLTVLLLSDASPNQERFWQNILKNWIDGPLDCHFHRDPYITQQELAHLTKDYDLLITDVTMPELKSFCPVITINSYPTTKDFAIIQAFIDSYDPSCPQNKGKVG